MLAVAALVTTLTACATGPGAVVPGAVARGGDFQFVSPGGQTKIFYDPPDTRGTVQNLGGESLTKPGKQITVSDYRGKVVVLNIWGSWCGPCRREMPELQKVYDQTKGSGVQLLGIDVRDEVRSAPEDFVRDTGITYPSIYDPPGRSLLALKGYPQRSGPSGDALHIPPRVG